MSYFVLMGIFLSTLLTACSDSNTTNETEDLFAKGEYLCLEAQWGEARNVLREFLLANPNHPGAHFYLGRSYLLWEEDFRPVIAEGELQTALQLFYENDNVSYIERFPADYFEMICNIESVKVCLKEFAILESMGAPKSRLRPIAKRARTYLEAARVADSDHNDVIVFEDLVRSMESFAAAPINGTN